MGKSRTISFNRPHLGAALLALLALIILALFTAWAASDWQDLGGWLQYLITLAAGALILWLGWRSLKVEQAPGWLAGLLVLAALLRLGLGIFWDAALPAWGYQSEVELAGYIMEDAFERDSAAWELAESGQPLWQALSETQSSDQYGGLLLLSASIYRLLGGGSHQPLLMVIFGAAIAALAILFTWAFTRMLAGERAAALAAWGIALYPEAVLLGSSQMREAYTITLAAVSLYGLLRYRRDHRATDLLFVLIPLAVCLLISPPAAVLILLALVAAALALERRRLPASRRLWLLLGLLVVLAVIGLWAAWGQFAPQGVSTPLDLINWWLRKAVDLQAYESRQASGWIQRIFRSTPEVLHMPLLFVYGVARPFLPAALGAGGAPLWQAIGIWRALGWAVLLVLLLYAAWIWLRSPRRTAVLGALMLVVWLSILVASIRSGGDLWDNPRYRTTLASVQIMLAAWGVVEGRQLRDPWLKRIAVGATLIFAWFVPWYLRRYTSLPWPVVDPFKTLGLGLASAVLFMLADWAASRPAKPPPEAVDPLR